MNKIEKKLSSIDLEPLCALSTKTLGIRHLITKGKYNAAYAICKYICASLHRHHVLTPTVELIENSKYLTASWVGFC